MSPLPSTMRSGRSPHCSDANSVPVRPKPVATSSQISSTSCSRHAACNGANVGGRGELHPRGALHERLDDHGRELARVRADQASPRPRSTRGPRSAARAAPGSAADRTRRCRSRRRRRRARRWCRRGTRRRTRGTRCARVHPRFDPVLERDLQGLLDRARAVGREQEVRIVDRHDGPRAPRPARRRHGCRCRASWSAHRGRAGRGSRASSSGTRCPSVLTHSDEIASR